MTVQERDFPPPKISVNSCTDALCIESHVGECHRPQSKGRHNVISTHLVDRVPIDSGRCALTDAVVMGPLQARLWGRPVCLPLIPASLQCVCVSAPL